MLDIMIRESLCRGQVICIIYFDLLTHPLYGKTSEKLYIMSNLPQSQCSVKYITIIITKKNFGVKLKLEIKYTNNMLYIKRDYNILKLKLNALRSHSLNTSHFKKGVVRDTIKCDTV